jgi:hypothetical protein
MVLVAGVLGVATATRSTTEFVKTIAVPVRTRLPAAEERVRLPAEADHVEAAAAVMVKAPVLVVNEEAALPANDTAPVS